jgi:ubiquinone/menaquinone biosynthesis C-methylase UbiE
MQSTEQKEQDEQMDQKDLNYSKKEFWNNRFSSTEGNFDWYADWTQLKPHFTPLLTNESLILNVGCGNSKMSNQMYQDNFKSITNIDISNIVISKMKQQYPDQTFIEMDATNMTFPSNNFDVCIDKGTLDALMCSDNLDLATKLIQEMHRVTKVNGYYTIITHGEPKHREHIYEKILNEGSYELQSIKVKLSFMSNLINSLRNNCKDHSIKSAVKDKNVFIASVLDAFVNSYDDSDLSEDQKKAKKKAALQLKLLKMLNKYDNVEDLKKKIQNKEVEGENKEGQKEEEQKEEGKNSETKKEEEDKKEEGNNSEVKKDEKKEEDTGKEKKKGSNIVRRNHCWLYIFKKIKE